MSVREEERQKSCPSRGLGLAAAAIGVGVGAALYYFFSKRPESENPSSEGATRQEDWHCEPVRPLSNHNDSLYTTISVNTTTDTSIMDTDSDNEYNVDYDEIDDTNNFSIYDDDNENYDDAEYVTDDNDDGINSGLDDTNNSVASENGDTNSEPIEISSQSSNEGDDNSDVYNENSDGINENSDVDDENSGVDDDNSGEDDDNNSGEDDENSDGNYNSVNSDENNSEGSVSISNDENEMDVDNVSVVESNDDSDHSGFYLNPTTNGSDTEDRRLANILRAYVLRRLSIDTESDWDVTQSSSDIPSHDGPSTTTGWISLFSPRVRNQRQDQATKLREKAFRERSWSLEECSICFEVMLKDEELMTLPCTHNFHSQCIMPWLQEKQTCPNCRKSAD